MSGFVILGLIVIAIAALVFYFITIYNNLVELKNNVKRNWSNIDVLLKQRHDELPKLVESCKQYMKHEQGTLEKVMQARSAVMAARDGQSMKALGQAESQLRMGLGNLFAVAENYPDLKANQSFAQLQVRITALENSIADRREFYNESVNLNNIRIEQFPDVLIAKRYGFKEADLLEFDEEETKDVDLKNAFDG
jgi:LemA protein